jgi:hypothetical protein
MKKKKIDRLEAANAVSLGSSKTCSGGALPRHSKMD